MKAFSNRLIYLFLYIWGISIWVLGLVDLPGQEKLTKFKFDKFIHSFQYFIFSLLLFKVKSKNKKTILFVCVFCILQELSQFFVAYRSVELSDILFNFLGILGAIFISKKREQLNK